MESRYENYAAAGKTMIMPPSAPALQMLGHELAVSVKDLHELASQARAIADNIFGPQPDTTEAGRASDPNGVAGSIGAANREVASLRIVTRDLRDQLNRLSGL